MKLCLMTAALLAFAPLSEAWGKTCSEQSSAQNTSNLGSKPVSFDDCMKSARLECERTARQRKLIEAAKDTFMKRCLAEATGK
jgi:hypothetical protein